MDINEILQQDISHLSKAELKGRLKYLSNMDYITEMAIVKTKDEIKSREDISLLHKKFKGYVCMFYDKKEEFTHWIPNEPHPEGAIMRPFDHVEQTDKDSGIRYYAKNFYTGDMVNHGWKYCDLIKMADLISSDSDIDYSSISDEDIEGCKYKYLRDWTNK